MGRQHVSRMACLLALRSQQNYNNSLSQLLLCLRHSRIPLFTFLQASAPAGATLALYNQPQQDVLEN